MMLSLELPESQRDSQKDGMFHLILKHPKSLKAPLKVLSQSELAHNSHPLIQCGYDS